MIDLRSDTKTLPTPAMREAMARAECGDDVSREDPTVNRLEEMAATRLGKEAACLVTSGTQGNLTSLMANTHPGQAVICHEQSHVVVYEQGGYARIAGLALYPLPGKYGVIAPETLEAIFPPKEIHRVQPGVVCLENTHNICGGTVLTAAEIGAVADAAHAHGVPLHIDGARIFNAAVALGVPAADLAAPADTVTFCFSKGLGAPVGSIVCGTAETIERVRWARKVLGGGLRQAGVIAAAAIVALEQMVERLAEDHANARQIAETLAGCRGIEVDLASVQTNIVRFNILRDRLTAQQLCEQLKDEGVLGMAAAPQAVRLVTHADVSAEDTRKVCEVVKTVLA